MRSLIIPQEIQQHNQALEVLKGKLPMIRSKNQELNFAVPDVTIIIPALNEEAGILRTLSSLSASHTIKSVEIIVVNNNSTDATEALALAAGVSCITETTQGVAAARNAGLQKAAGKFILNADSDTIYPPEWIDIMLSPLQDDRMAMVYGNFSFIPSPGISRISHLGYEYISDLSKWINRKFREEALNVYGFNSAFRKTEGIAVQGFDHPPGTNEDGWLAVKLRNIFQKKLFHVTDRRAMVWTSDRRLHLDGGMFKAFIKRLRRNMSGKKFSIQQSKFKE